MRIRTFTGRTASDAIALVRSELGDDAVILHVEDARTGKGVIVRAAAEGEARPAVEIDRAAPLPPEARLEAMLRAALQRTMPINLRAA
jgi:flagellar biosynthesis GTPase FlhF